MDIYLCVDIKFYFVVKECDDIYHLGRNEYLEFIAIKQFIHVLEEKFCMRDSL